MPLLELNNYSISYHFPVQTTIVDTISLQIDHGEITALVGESGAGKTTLGLSLLGLLNLKNNVQISGQIIFDGVEIHGSDNNIFGKYRGRRIGYIFQEPLLALNPVFSIGEQLRETIHYHFKTNHAKQQALNWLEKCELTPAQQYYRYYPHQLSGGMRQRVMIALALACDPDLVVADEPTSGVDAALKLEIMSLLIKQCQNNKSILLITHDIGLAAKYSQKLFVMYQGQIIESGRTENIINSPVHSYTRTLIEKFMFLINAHN
ncbi:ABC transporter ATP-binding protein [candidate division KSB1 bacterium]|nr:ABC transporter ATP-binding protein [candidate division KSB1 bacterium]